MKDNIIKKCYLAAFDINDKNLKDLMIINTKCLVDDGKNRYVYIDSNRLKDELIYYRFYGEIPSYNSILNLILPAILANTNIFGSGCRKNRFRVKLDLRSKVLLY